MLFHKNPDDDDEQPVACVSKTCLFLRMRNAIFGVGK